LIGIVFGGTLTSSMRRVYDVGTGTEIWSGAASPDLRSALEIVPRLSPIDGIIAASDTAARVASTATHLYDNGTLYTAVSGWALGWLDENRLLLNRYTPVGAGSQVSYSGAVVVNASGQQVQSPPLPELFNVQSAGVDTVYSRDSNKIFSLSSGASVWSSVSPTTGKGGVTQAHVVFGSGNTVRIEPL
ncbi:MAG: hypothetical protein ABW171_02010, partial [Steroidobacter sp.]